MDITFQFTKKRNTFGAQCLFCEQGPELMDSIPTDFKQHRNFILRNPVHEMVQNIPEFSEHEINTQRVICVSTGVNHAEGGWPKDVNYNDPEQTQRYRRKIEKEDAYLHCVMSQAPETEHIILQNNAIDMYKTYFSELNPWPGTETNSIRTVNIFRDKYERPVTSLTWVPHDQHRFVVTYSEMDFYGVATTPLECYLWNIAHPSDPEYIIKPVHPMLDLKCSPRETDIMVGALSNGQSAYFDIRVGSSAIAHTPTHNSHRCFVKNIIFINSKSGKEFFSSGGDGACKWWDLRYLKNPTDEMIMDAVQFSFETASMARAPGISATEFESTMPTRFSVGTENGLLMIANRKGKTQLEKIPMQYKAHLGPVWSISRNPNYMKVFLTVGDWTTKIWSEECHESPILWTPSQKHNVTCGSWSPTRSSLFMLTHADGKITIWDVLRKQHEPIIKRQLCSEALLRMSYQDGGGLAAVGSSKGQTFLMELSESLIYPGRHDKILLGLLFDREIKRERILEARVREIKLKQKQAMEDSPRTSADDTGMETSENLNEITQEYFHIVRSTTF